MESSSPHGSDTTTSSPVDPAADLELLERARSTAPVDEFLQFGPSWYAPLLATFIAGLSLFGESVTSAGNIAAGVVGGIAGSVVAIHDVRSRAVRSRPSKRSIGFLALMLVVCWVIIAAWGTAQSTLGFDRFVPWYAAFGWLLTTIAFLAIRHALLSIRRRRAPLR